MSYMLKLDLRYSPVGERLSLFGLLPESPAATRTPTSHEALLSHPRATRYVAEFMLQTGLLGQFRHCDVEPEPVEDDETTGQN
ncbi:uncharacterized protein N7503_001247 [Penicillium pulvis]|uniref:uncharacterized protein n=1 Tax=Penicillium pulvis TaxID=1562058 RepID=UPI0025482491|nr:uncharacterized protein N7503_001247 [Penicillium pulvis]KAJ5809029.1 hypothetical protein N7503_001247 [Penicillium pulvis]